MSQVGVEPFDVGIGSTPTRSTYPSSNPRRRFIIPSHIIQHAGLTIVEVDHLEPAIGRHAGFDQRFTRFQDTWTKLQVFGLVDYERVILIDSDMIFLRSMDELFEMALQGRDWIAAAPACVCNPLKLVSYPEDWCVLHNNSIAYFQDPCELCLVQARSLRVAILPTNACREWFADQSPPQFRSSRSTSITSGHGLHSSLHKHIPNYRLCEASGSRCSRPAVSWPLATIAMVDQRAEAGTGSPL